MMEVEAVMINLLQELAQEEAKRAEEEARLALAKKEIMDKRRRQEQALEALQVIF